MKTFLAELKTSALLTLVFAVLLCGVYPLAVWAGAQALFADQANGSLVTDTDGTVRGSRLLAQNFSSAKYFAIIPAMLVGAFPAIAPLNIMGLVSPSSAILSAVIFNALVIIALIPLALRGVAYRPVGAAAMLRRNLLIYGLGGIIIPLDRKSVV